MEVIHVSEDGVVLRLGWLPKPVAHREPMPVDTRVTQQGAAGKRRYRNFSDMQLS